MTFLYIGAYEKLLSLDIVIICMYIAITAGCDGKGKSPTLVVKVESKFQPFNDVNGTIEILSRIGIGQLSSWNLEGENQNKIDELQLF